MKTKKLLIVTNVDWFLISHRLILARSAVQAGWQVYVACEDTGKGNQIAVDGIKFINFPLSRSGMNPVGEYKLYKRFLKLYNEIKPDVVHQITIKPVVYGSLAAQVVGIKGVVNAISGLGYMFTAGKVGILQKIILYLMKKGASKSNVSFIFQNFEDGDVLAKYGVSKGVKSVNFIKGSGIDLEKFPFTETSYTGKIKILFASRMLWDKGLKELREAADLLKSRFKYKIQFVLIGKTDDQNKASVPTEYLMSWSDGDYVLWKGHVEDVLEEYMSSQIVVLPSYREGLPKNLIEACAIGRPIITTEAIGCKDCVDQGVNGLKVPVGDSLALANAIETLIHDPVRLEDMGRASRHKAELEFDIKDVIKKHLNIYNDFLS